MMFQAMSVWAMVLLTSGIVDEGPCQVGVGVSTASLLEWNVSHGHGGGVLAHCWAVRNHILCLSD